MNVNGTIFKRDVEAIRLNEAKQRAQRLRRDFHTRGALQHYLTHCSPLGVTADDLLKPFVYLDNVATADFRWEDVWG